MDEHLNLHCRHDDRANNHFEFCDPKYSQYINNTLILKYSRDSRYLKTHLLIAHSLANSGCMDLNHFRFWYILLASNYMLLSFFYSYCCQLP